MFYPRVAESYGLSPNLFCRGMFFSTYSFFGSCQVLLNFKFAGFFAVPTTRLRQSNVDRAGADADQWAYRQLY